MTAPIASLRLAGATLSTRNISRARQFYEEVLNLECVRPAADRLIVRDRRVPRYTDEGERRYWVLDVRQVDEISRPQTMFDHFGLYLASSDDVEAVHAALSANKERYGVGMIDKVRDQHGSRSFYFVDADLNWWEFDHQPETRSNTSLFAAGDAYHD